MDSFAKYTIIDWIAFIQVLLIWFIWLTGVDSGLSV